MTITTITGTDAAALTGRRCYGCKTYQAPSAFARDRNGPDSLDRYCRVCRCARSAAYYRAHHPEAQIKLPRTELTPTPNPSISYTRAHDRIRAARGRAVDHPCQHCAGTAHQWAYTHDDPNELRAPAGPSHLITAYSADPTHYIPLCRSCHRRYDFNRHAATADAA